VNPGVDARVRAWLPEIVLVTLVVLAGVLERGIGLDVSARLLLLAAAVAGFRRAPGASLALVWLLALLHVATATPVLLTEVAVGLVAFGCARWGRTATVVLSGLSIPASAAVAVVLVTTGSFRLFSDVGQFGSIVDTAYSFSDELVVGAAALGMLALALPWLAGLALRATERARASQASQEAAEEQTERARREAEQAHEIARLRDDQARLARDVHDVVGHSLAVILAQAESAQYLPDDDGDRLKQTMATIATSARSSLQDVRHVLTAAAGEQAGAVAPRPLDTLVDGVRASGHEVVSRELGTPQPMPPDLEVVAYRVLQEMLTNAIKHGTRDEPVFVERLWPDGSWAGELRIEVRNGLDVARDPVTDETQPLTAVPGPAPRTSDDGRGLDGMRRRLEACGGRLDVRRRDGERPGEPATFTTTAWVPVRTVSP
jgi:signal transduction histidine kinase